MSDQLSNLYFYALELGISAKEYWEMSINEIIDTMDSLQRQRRRKEKQRIMDNFILAEMLTANLATLISGKGDIKRPWEYYPELFEKEQERYQKAEEDRKWEQYKENRRAYMAEWNRRRHQ